MQIRDKIIRILVWSDGRPHSSRYFMPMLFHVCRQGSPARWTVLLEGQLYGEYLDKDQAVIDAVEAAREAQDGGRTAEVWEGAVRVF